MHKTSECCPICTVHNADVEQILDDNNGTNLHFLFSCKLCGRFHAPERAYREQFTTLDEKGRAKAAIFIRNQNLIGNEPCFNQQSCGKGSVQYKLMQTVEIYPNTISEILDRTLINMHRLTPGLGKPADISETDYPLFYALDWQELLFIKNALEKREFIRTAGVGDKLRFNIEPSGLLHLERINKGMTQTRFLWQCGLVKAQKNMTSQAKYFKKL